MQGPTTSPCAGLVRSLWGGSPLYWFRRRWSLDLPAESIQARNPHQDWHTPVHQRICRMDQSGSVSRRTTPGWASFVSSPGCWHVQCSAARSSRGAHLRGPAGTSEIARDRRRDRPEKVRSPSSLWFLCQPRWKRNDIGRTGGLILTG